MVNREHRASDTRKPYSGLSRSLVIAIDVGTTFSGVSYALLEPGEIPKITGVTRFPGQEHVAGNSKIPSVIYYDKHGNIMAAGAEADNSSVAAQAEEDGWIKAELFKLRLRPRTMQLNMNGMRLTPLPKRKTPVHVFGDYLAYLVRCTRSFICDTYANGLSLWNSVEADIQYVLSHPNGWEGPQQTRMRNAAVYGKLVTDNDVGRARIRFVTEGEASLHACVLSGLAADVLSNPSKNGFLILDAGGGTLDISAYAIKGTSPLAMEEIAPPDCIFAGSVFVSRRAREFLEEKLKNSKYGSADSLDHITRKFDETTKRLFRDRHELQFIPFGSPLDKDPAVGIRSGQLRLSGNEVANLFEPSVDAAVNAIKSQIDASNGIIRSVFLVGGYAASPWLFGQLQERLAPFNVKVSRPDTQTSKAVADGAIGFYCDHHVSARMSKFMYGVEFLRELDMSDPEHVKRKEKLCELPSGPKLLPDAFDCILARGVKVKESTVFTRKYCTELTSLSMLAVFEVEIWCYRGGNTVPKWINRQDDNYSTLCVVQADLSMLTGTAETKSGKNGKKYWTIVFSVEIHFGLTEFKARMKWMDDGQVRYGPAVIVYNERGHRIEDDDVDVYPEDDQSYQPSRSDKNRNSPSSRSIDPYYPPASASGGSSSRRASNAGIPDVTRMERSASKGYTASIAPSARSTATATPATAGPYSNPLRGSDSDSDRKKGKDRERDRESRYKDDDRSMRSAAYGASPISKIGSTGSAVGDQWGANAPSGGYTPSHHSPSMRPPHSRQTSMYGGEPSPSIGGGGDQWGTGGDTGGDSWGGAAPPMSAVDEQRQSHLWDGEQPQSTVLDSMLDRPKTPYVDRPKSPYGHHDALGGTEGVGGGGEDFDFAQQSEQHHHQQSSPGFGRSPSPFVDRPKSGVPPSMFGDAPPAMFGDSGPAADAGAGGTSLFGGEPPASVFGETNANANAADGWGFGSATTPAAETPPATTTTAKKGKRKTSAAASAAASAAPSTPASGLASRTSPSFGANKSPFGGASTFDDIGGGIGGSPAAASTGGSGGLWGSKAPSPYDKGKPLSPLNPAAQMNETPAQIEDSWGFDNSNNNNNNSGGDGWGTTGGPSWGGVAEESKHSRQPSRVPSPAPPPGAAEPVVATPVEETTVSGKKKKKKGSAATTPAAKSPGLFGIDTEQEERKKKEKDDEEKRERDEQEKREEREREEREKEEREKEEREKEEREQREKEEREREAEAATLRKEEEDKAAREQKEKDEAAAAPTSLFGNTTSVFGGGFSSSSALNPPDKPWLSTDTGGGDDSWGGGGVGGWGATSLATGKKKKGKLGASAVTPTTAPKSAFGSGIGGGWGFGNALGGDSSEPAAATLSNELSSSGGGGLFDFNTSSGPDLGFGTFGAKAPSRAASPAPGHTELEATTDIYADIGLTAEGGEGSANPLGGDDTVIGGDEGGDGDDKKKKKKKKKAGGVDTPAADEPPTTPAVEESPPVADPVADPDPDTGGAEIEPAFTATTATKKKKKKK